MTSSAYDALRSSAPPEYKPCHDNVAVLRAELKATADERDLLLREVEHLHSRLDNGHQLSMSGSELHQVQSYDRLKAQCDTAVDELHMLQQQYSDMVCVFVIGFLLRYLFSLFCLVSVRLFLSFFSTDNCEPDPPKETLQR